MLSETLYIPPRQSLYTAAILENGGPSTLAGAVRKLVRTAMEVKVPIQIGDIIMLIQIKFKLIQYDLIDTT